MTGSRYDERTNVRNEGKEEAGGLAENDGAGVSLTLDCKTSQSLDFTQTATRG